MRLYQRFSAFLVAGLLASFAGPAAAETGVTEDTIKIGVPGPFTGNASSYSKAQIGLHAFFQHINDQGGVHGRKIEVIRADTACDETNGIAAAKRLINQDEVFMIHGNSCSGVALAMKPTIVEAGLPWMVAHAVNQNISTPVTRNVFHGVPTSIGSGVTMADFAMSKPDTKNVAIISHSNEWSAGYRKPAIEQLKEEYGIEPALELRLERGATDATPHALKIQQADVDFVLAILYEAETVQFLRAADKYGLEMPILGAYGTDLQSTRERIGSLGPVKNYMVLHMFQGTVDSAVMQKWADMIHKYYPDEELSAFSFASIGSGRAVVKALEAAGRDLTREKLMDELENIRGFDTGILAGDITFTPDDHTGVGGSAVAGYDENGEQVIYESWGKPIAQ